MKAICPEEYSAERVTAYSWRASELFCAGVYYTNKALSADPRTMSNIEWQECYKNANEYWDALDEILVMLQENVDENTFERMFNEQNSQANSLFVTTAYAADSEGIINTFDSAKAGQRLKAVAEYLGRDMSKAKEALKYAASALKMANGEITASEWNNFAQTARNLETAARITKTATQTAAIIAGGPATGALEGASLVVGGASLIWQATDDGCFVAMGDSYDSSEFVANLQKVSNFVAPIAFTSGMLTMDFSSAKGAVLASYDFAENIRGLFQDGKIVGIELKGPTGMITSLTKEELLEYQAAKENGQNLPYDIEALLNMLNLQTIPTMTPQSTPTPVMTPVLDPTPEPSAAETQQPAVDNRSIVGTWKVEYLVEDGTDSRDVEGFNAETDINMQYLIFNNDGTVEMINRYQERGILSEEYDFDNGSGSIYFPNGDVNPIFIDINGLLCYEDMAMRNAGGWQLLFSKVSN